MEDTTPVVEEREEYNEDVSQINNPEESRNNNDIGFPVVKKKKRKIFPLVILLVLIGLAAGIYYVFFSTPKIEEESTSGVSIVEQSTPTPTSMIIEIERNEVSFEILNGTGIAGDAKKLQEKLEALGYEIFEVGNADNKNYETTIVTFDTSLPELFKNEITKELEEYYDSVDVETKQLTDFKVRIITGLPQGYTVTPTKSKTTSTPTPTGSISTPTLTMTPTPTI